MYSDRALVIGAGFAGLLAARVLSESYGDVVLVERDQIAADTEHRAATPQAHDPHTLLARGAEVLDTLFPRLGAELEYVGAVRADVGSDFLIRSAAGWAPRDHVGLSVLSTSRTTIERIIRRRVLKLPNVSLVDGVTIDGLLHDRGTVTGVHGRRDTPSRRDTVSRDTVRGAVSRDTVRGAVSRDTVRDAVSADTAFTDYADLVVDASGRNSKLVSWLAELGVHCPAPMIVNGHLACSSRLYHVNPDLKLDWKTAREFTHAPTTKRGGAVASVDGSHWFVTLFSAGGEAAPTDEDGFLSHATELECQDIAEIIKTATPASPIHHAGNLRSRWNRFHKVPNWPRGLLALGDSVVSLNPVHGHGTTLAALNCADLRTLLHDHDLSKEPQLFQRAVAKAAWTPWTSATTHDLGWSTRRRSPSARFAQWYARRLADLIPHSRQVYRACVRVSQMVDHPTALLRPAVLGRVLAGRVLVGRYLSGSRPQARER